MATTEQDILAGITGKTTDTPSEPVPASPRPTTTADDDVLAGITGKAAPKPKNESAYQIGDVQDAMRNAGWDEKDIVKGSAIVWHEGAQGRARANRKASAAENAALTGGRGIAEDSVGPFQINWPAWKGKLEAQGIKRDDLYDLDTAAKVAKEVKAQQGWNAWKLANTKYHQQYLPMAREAYRAGQQSSPTSDIEAGFSNSPRRSNDATNPPAALTATDVQGQGQQPVTPQAQPVPPTMLTERNREAITRDRRAVSLPEPLLQTPAAPAGQYDTKLDPQEEDRFQQWKAVYAPHDSGEDYDLRGAFKAGLRPDPKTGHWPDTFKKPNHPTFSNQSQYAKGENAAKAGTWQGDKFIPPPSQVTQEPFYVDDEGNVHVNPGANISQQEAERIAAERTAAQNAASAGERGLSATPEETAALRQRQESAGPIAIEEQAKGAIADYHAQQEPRDRAVVNKAFGENVWELSQNLEPDAREALIQAATNITGAGDQERRDRVQQARRQAQQRKRQAQVTTKDRNAMLEEAHVEMMKDAAEAAKNADPALFSKIMTPAITAKPADIVKYFRNKRGGLDTSSFQETPSFADRNQRFIDSKQPMNVSRAHPQSEDGTRAAIRQQVISESPKSLPDELPVAYSGFARAQMKPTAVEEEVNRRYEEQQAALAERKRIFDAMSPADKDKFQREVGVNIGNILTAGSKGAAMGWKDFQAQSRRIGAGIMDIISRIPVDSANERHIADSLRIQAMALEDAISKVNENSPLTMKQKAAEKVVNLVGGLVLNSPAMVTNPIAGFAAMSAVQARGHNLSWGNTATEAIKGAAIGAVFKGADFLPPAGGSFAEQAAALGKQSLAIGAGTAGVELASGAPLSKALESAGTNVLLHGIFRAPKIAESAAKAGAARILESDSAPEWAKRAAEWWTDYQKQQQASAGAGDPTSGKFDASPRVEAAINDIRKNGASAEAKAFFAGIEPRLAGTTIEKVAEFAKGLGIPWEPDPRWVAAEGGEAPTSEAKPEAKTEPPKPRPGQPLLPSEPKDESLGTAYTDNGEGFTAKPQPLIRTAKYDESHTVTVLDDSGTPTKVTPYDLAGSQARSLTKQGENPADFVHVVFPDGTHDIYHVSDIQYPQGGQTNATDTGKQQGDDLDKHKGVPPGENLPGDTGQVRQGEGGQAGGGSSLGEQPAPPVVEPAPPEESLPGTGGKEDVKLEPWQQKRADYITSHLPKGYAEMPLDQQRIIENNLRRNHMVAVRAAQEEKKDVPQEVLDELDARYPPIKPAEPEPEPEPAAEGKIDVGSRVTFKSRGVDVEGEVVKVLKSAEGRDSLHVKVEGKEKPVVINREYATLVDAGVKTVDEGANEAHPEPTDAQKEADNYRQGHIRLGGMRISIETAAGIERKGKDPSGKPWAVTMQSHYGKILGTKGADGEHLDVVVRPGIPEGDYEGPVFVVHQTKGNGHFDEHKVLMGWDNEADARKAYLANYTKGWDKRIRSIHPFENVDAFKEWLKTGDTTKPVEPQAPEEKPEYQGPSGGEHYKGHKIERALFNDEFEVTKNGERVEFPKNPMGTFATAEEARAAIDTLTSKAKASDKSVQDHSQRASISGDTITVTSYVGRQKASSFQFPVSEWEATSRHPNPNYPKSKIIEKYTREMDDQPGGPDQAARIRDSMRYAVDKAMKEREGATPEPESDDRHGENYKGYTISPNDLIVRNGKPVGFIVVDPDGRAVDSAPSRAAARKLVDDDIQKSKPKPPAPPTAPEEKPENKPKFTPEQQEKIDRLRKKLGNKPAAEREGAMGMPAAPGEGESAHFDEADILDAADIGNTLFDSGTRDLDEWRATMRDLLGDGVDEHLEQIYDSAVMQHEQEGKDVADLPEWTAPKAETKPEEKPEPKPEPEGQDKALIPGTHDLIAKILGDYIETETELKFSQLDRLAEEAFGGTQADGTYGSGDMYDAMGAALAKFIASQTSRLWDNPVKTLEWLRGIVSRLPTRTMRNREQLQRQQFSTPPTIGFVASTALQLRPEDIALEPSAGEGLLASFLKAFGVAQIHVNDKSERRLALLKSEGYTSHHDVDAQQINARLDQSIRPTVVFMNPPFSTAEGIERHDTRNGFEHLLSALQRLEQGGRLVAIMGESAQLGKEIANEFWDKISREYNVRATLPIPGSEYRKFGTTFGTLLVVIDKNGPTEGANFQERFTNVRRDEKSDLEGILDVIKELPARDATTGVGSTSGSDSTGGRTGGGRGPTDTKHGGETKPEDGDTGTDEGKPRGSEESDGGEGTQPEGEGQSTESGEDAGNGPATEESNNMGEAGVQTTTTTQHGKSESEGSVFAQYKPAKLQGGVDHPGNIVESATLAAVEPPDITYQPHLDPELIKQGILSNMQLETIVYTGQSHEVRLPDGRRRAFYAGHGTGSGKGRIVMGIALDNWNQGRKRILYVSKNFDLVDEARRDLSALLMLPENATAEEVQAQVPLLSLNKFRMGDELDELAGDGIMFTSYDTLGSENAARNTSRMKDIVKWLGKEGVIMFDEAHLAKNATPSQGQATKRGGNVVALQEGPDSEPDWRVVYASATPATEVLNMGYMSRLGLWGHDLGFPDFQHFAVAIQNGGLGAMEIVAQDMKSLGMYLATQLSYKGVTYRTLTHKLEDFQGEQYDTAARAWQTVLREFEKALSDQRAPGRAKGRIRSAFQGAQLMFFRQLTTALKMPTLIADINDLLRDGTDYYEEPDIQEKMEGSADLPQFESGRERQHGHIRERGYKRSLGYERERGYGGKPKRKRTRASSEPELPGNVGKTTHMDSQVVVSFIYTGDARSSRQVAAADAEGGNYDDLDMSPKDILMNQIERYYPTQLYITRPIPNTNKTERVPATDDEGNVIHDPVLLAKKAALIASMDDFVLPDNPMDLLLQEFGADKVAEISGRKKRMILGKGGEREWVSRTGAEAEGRRTSQKKANNHEREDFQNGIKKIAMISGAADTGISLHADLLKPSANARRTHFVVEPAWSSDKFTQGLGRSHRTNQRSAPDVAMVKTEIGGEARFFSSVARRLASAGAISRGERRATGGGDMESYDYENSYGVAAATKLMNDIASGAHPSWIPQDMDLLDTIKRIGLTVPLDPNDWDGTHKVKDSHLQGMEVGTLLNRLLALERHEQDVMFRWFDAEFQHAVEMAKQNGTFDTGIGEIRGQSIRVVGKPQIVGRDQSTGATTKYYKVEADIPTEPVPIDDLLRMQKDGPGRSSISNSFWQQKTSKNIIFVREAHPTTSPSTGRVSWLFYQFRPGGKLDTLIGQDNLAEKYDPVEIDTRLEDPLKGKEIGEVLFHDEGGKPKPGSARELRPDISQVDPDLVDAIAKYKRLGYLDYQTSDKLHERYSDQVKSNERIEAALERILKGQQSREVKPLDLRQTVRQWWNQHYTDDAGFKTKTFHLITSPVVPIWNRLQGRDRNGNPTRLRVMRAIADTGQRIVGVNIPPGSVRTVLAQLGVGQAQRSAEEIFNGVFLAGETVELLGGSKIRRTRFRGNPAIELANIKDTDVKMLSDWGVKPEGGLGGTKYFISTKPEVGIPLIEKIIKQFPVFDPAAQQQAQQQGDDLGSVDDEGEDSGMPSAMPAGSRDLDGAVDAAANMPDGLSPEAQRENDEEYRDKASKVAPGDLYSPEQDEEGLAEYEERRMGRISGGHPIDIRMDPEAGFEKVQVSTADVRTAFLKMFKAIGHATDIRSGRMGRYKNALGLTWQNSQIMRLREAWNIPVMTHEAGHALQHAIYGHIYSKAIAHLPIPVRRELIKLGKALYGSTKPNGGYTSEGFAEFMRHYLTSDNAQVMAPRMFDYFENTILPANPRLAKELPKVKKVIDQYRFQGEMNRSQAQMESGDESLPIKLQKAIAGIKHLRTDWIDEGTPIHDWVREYQKLTGEKFDPSQDPWKLYNFFRGAGNGVTRTMLENDMIDADFNPVGPSFKQAVVGPIGNLGKKWGMWPVEILGHYLWALRAIERLSPNIMVEGTGGALASKYPREAKEAKDPGKTREQAMWLKQTIENEFPEMQIAAAGWYQWWDGVMDYVKGINPDLAPYISKQLYSSAFYAPLNRAFDEMTTPLLGKRRPFSGTPTIMHMRGSERRITNILSQTFLNVERLISNAHKHRVLTALTDVDGKPGIGQIFEKVARNMQPQNLSLEQIRKQLEDLGIDTSGAHGDEVLTYFLPMQHPGGRDPIMPVVRGGKVEWFHIPSELYNTLSGLDMFRPDRTLMVLLGYQARAFRLGTTGLRPSFGLFTNLVRDIPTWLGQSQAKIRNPIARFNDYMHGMASLVGYLMKNPQAGKLGELREYHDLFNRLNIGMSQPLGYDIAATRHEVNRLARPQGTKGLIAHPLRRIRTATPIDFLREIFGIAEAFPRTAEIKEIMEDRGRKPGDRITLDDAIEMGIGGRQSTVDFLASGRKGKYMNQVVPFFNPSIQGTRSFLRAFKRNPLNAILVGAGMAMASLLWWWLNKDKEWYRSLRPFERVAYWNIKVGDQILQIPRSQEWGSIFGSIPEVLMDAAYQQNPAEATAAFAQIADNLIPPVAPVPVRAGLEQAANWNEFVGRPIVPRNLEARPAVEQRNEYTSEVARYIAKMLPNARIPYLNIPLNSPMRIDAAIREFFGGMGADIAQAPRTARAAGRAVSGVLNPSAKSGVDYDPADLPIIGRGFRRGGTLGTGSSSAQNTFYSMLDEARTNAMSKEEHEGPEERGKRLALESANVAIKSLRDTAAHTEDKAKKRIIYREMDQIADRAAKGQWVKPQ